MWLYCSVWPYYHLSEVGKRWKNAKAGMGTVGLPNFNIARPKMEIIVRTKASLRGTNTPSLSGIRCALRCEGPWQDYRAGTAPNAVSQKWFVQSKASLGSILQYNLYPQFQNPERPRRPKVDLVHLTQTHLAAESDWNWPGITNNIWYHVTCDNMWLCSLCVQYEYSCSWMVIAWNIVCLAIRCCSRPLRALYNTQILYAGTH